MREFGEVMNEAALFLTHIHTLEIAIWREGEPDASTIRRLQVLVSPPLYSYTGICTPFVHFR